jgi:D-3-phosphoglycerate dehydrogenase
MKNKFMVFIPEPEWEESHKVFEGIADIKVGKPGEIYTEDRLIKEIKDVDAIIITSAQHITRKVIEASNKLKAIVKTGSKPGIDNVDIEAATEKGIVVGYGPGANSDSVAEHTITLILILLKKSFIASYQLKQGKWRDIGLLGNELMGKTLGIIGLGAVGCKVAEKIKGFGVKIIAFEPYNIQNAKEVGAKLVDLTTLLKESDIVTIHTNLTKDTTHLIGEKEFKLMKKSAFIINTARGAITDEKALIRALKEGWIAGAALDVFTEEPPQPDNPLLKMDNVVVTPHTASFTFDAFRKEAYMAVEGTLDVLQGKKPKYVVNPEVFKK